MAAGLHLSGIGSNDRVAVAANFDRLGTRRAAVSLSVPSLDRPIPGTTLRFVSDS